MRNLKTNIIFKVVAIIFLILVLMIPSSMVQSLIEDREQIQLNAIEEISEKWATGQTIAGPYLTIPFDEFHEEFVKTDSTTRMVKVRKYINVLPEVLNVTGDIKPEKRYRGIYEVVVYDSELKFKGKFNKVDFEKLGVDVDHIHFGKATINFGISDLKGIEKQISVDWNGEQLAFNPGLATEEIVIKGINAPVNLKDSLQVISSFSTSIDLKGSQHLYFMPFGKTTDVKLSSNWATPSFTGEYLPDSRSVNESGFEANWNILHLNRNYPQMWVGARRGVSKTTFGTNLLLPVDNYKKSNRVAKYSLLFLAITFLTFFFVEILNKVFIHPIQYLLVGVALIVFYVLLLSFSEHMLFDYSYLLASVLTLLLVALYSRAIMKSIKLAGLVTGILTVMYIFIFIIIQQEDLALLMGSVGMFIILALVMYFSRSIDWYGLKMDSDKME